ncbi:MAG: hypothetical protein KJ792_14280 [Actinobacteria bacterium]|nr:hypothetical protein [Actinomycetota bacterium]MCG2803758.1 hypothetical protein [Cellulomonas sp.]
MSTTASGRPRPSTAWWTFVVDPPVGDPARATATPPAGDAADQCALSVGDDADAVAAVTRWSPRQLEERPARRAAGAQDLLLVDVRQPGERSIVTIPGALAVPLDAILEGRGLAEISREGDVTLYCRSGARSEQAALALLAAGYRSVARLDGGILAWIGEVSPDLPRY